MTPYGNKIHEVVVKDAEGRVVQVITETEMSQRHWKHLDKPIPLLRIGWWRVHKELDLLFPELQKNGLM